MNLQQLIEQKKPPKYVTVNGQKTAVPEARRTEVARMSLAKALGISLRQLENRFRGEKDSVRPFKPVPHFRAATVSRQRKARP